MQPAVTVRPRVSRLAPKVNSTLLLCIAGLIIPNALSLTAPIFGLGTPPRTAAIIAYATVVLISRNVPPSLTTVLFLAVTVYDATATLALLFNLAPSEIGLALHLVGELKPFASPLYVALALGLTLMVGANIFLLTRYRAALRRGNPTVLMGAALAFATLDFAANTSLHYQFGTLYGAGKPVEAAVEQSGFRQAALAGSNSHVLFIMVEALGRFADPEQRALLEQPLRDPELLKRYDVQLGTVTYYGSTTAGEMRELCHTREPYQALLQVTSMACLPAELAAHGFRTIAIHNFTRHFFDRDRWYPKLGFERRIFGEDIAPTIARHCRGAFSGPCDVDVLPLVGRELREATQPTFVYWLTLSTHVPISPGQGTNRLGCRNGGGAITHVEVCYMTEMWIDLLQGIVDLTRTIPSTDILLVGDHAPPLWSKGGRNLFEPGHVPWIRLTPRRTVEIAQPGGGG